MTKPIVFLSLIILISACRNEPEANYDYVTAQFKEFSKKIHKVQYNVQTIDTFSSGGTVWNHKGFAVIERHDVDKIFGFSFFAKRLDIDDGYLYDKGNGFIISNETKSYKIERAGLGFLGSPGGQMICRDIFFMDTTYRSAKVVETEDKYLVMYEFDDDTIYDVTNIVKTIELNKRDFFPTKVTRSYEALGRRAVHQLLLSDVKINDAVQNGIDGYKKGFSDFEIVTENAREANRILNSELAEISLPNVLSGVDEVASFGSGNVTLIDFWEVWCGPCVKSLPEVEKIKTTYSDRLRVIGVVSEDKEAVIRLISKKGITFLNLFAGKDCLEKFSVDSYPRYFLIDKEGIVRNEYFGFSEAIEADIKRMIEE